jgi:hypothetical protein
VSDATTWGPAWVAAGLRAERRRIVRLRSRLLCRRGVPADVSELGREAYDAILAEIDTQIRGIEAVATEGT